jgi:hypothetical protein
MAESTSIGAKQTEKPRSSVRPARERAVQKQLVSIRHGAPASELIEDQAKGDGILQQRAAVRFVSGDVASPTPASAESRFAHDFSRVQARTVAACTVAPHTVAPQTRPGVQAQPAVRTPDDQYERETDEAAETVMPLSEPGLQLQPT